MKINVYENDDFPIEQRQLILLKTLSNGYKLITKFARDMQLQNAMMKSISHLERYRVLINEN